MEKIKLISGGQTGADQAGLDAWHALGFPTGGYAPKGYRTEDGNNPRLMALGLIETDKTDYEYRTILNIENSDGTLIFGEGSKGSTFTWSTALKLRKQRLWLPFPTYNPEGSQIQAVLNFLNTGTIQTLNVAGNRERLNPGIYSHVRKIMEEVGKRLIDPRERKIQYEER